MRFVSNFNILNIIFRLLNEGIRNSIPLQSSPWPTDNSTVSFLRKPERSMF